MADFFRRVEKKYILTREQYLYLKEIIKEKNGRRRTWKKYNL